MNETSIVSEETSFVAASGMGSWNKTFPETMDKESDSLSFVKRCVVIAISSIMYKRNVLPEQVFKKRRIENYIVVSMNTSDPIGAILHKKLLGMCQAIAKGYLDEVAVVFFPKGKDDYIFEAFTFKIHYDPTPSVELISGAGADRKTSVMQLKYEGPSQAKEDTFKMVRAIHVLTKKHMVCLPPNSDASIRLAYTLDTPEDYEAEGFIPSDTFYEIPGDVPILQIGHIKGAFHGITMACESTLIKDAAKAEADLENAKHEILQNASLMVQTESSQKDLSQHSLESRKRKTDSKISQKSPKATRLVRTNDLTKPSPKVIRV